jgi:hypothetical protein
MGVRPKRLDTCEMLAGGAHNMVVVTWRSGRNVTKLAIK